MCVCAYVHSQERWEAEQAKRTRKGGGNAEVLAEAAARDAEKYEMLFDDQIEYIKVCGSHCVGWRAHRQWLRFVTDVRQTPACCRG